MTATRPDHRRGVRRGMIAAVTVPVLVAGVSLGPAGAAEGDESRAGAQFISGEIGGTDLAEIAEIAGVEVENLGEGDAVTEANPLDITILETLPVDVGGVELPLGDILELGAVNQWASAEPGGVSSSAAGAVADQGGIGTGADGDFPGDAVLDLTGLIGDELGETLASLKLELGAISSEASLDGDTLESAYEIAGGNLRIAVPALSDLTAQVDDAVGTVDAAVQDLAGPDGTLAETLGTLDALDSLTDALAAIPLVSVEGPDLTVELDVDLAGAVEELLGTPIGAGDVVQLDLAAGELIVDLDALLEGGLSGLEPDTELLSPEVVADLVDRVTELLESLVDEIVELITEAVRAAGLEISITAEVSAVLVNDVLDLSMVTTLGELADGDASFEDNSTGVVVGVVGPLLAELADAVAAAAGGVVDDTLLGEGGVTSTVGETLQPVVDTATEALSPLGDLLPGLVSARVNVQNDEEGRFSVAALQIDVLPDEGLASIVLAESSVGPNASGGDGT